MLSLLVSFSQKPDLMKNTRLFSLFVALLLLSSGVKGEKTNQPEGYTFSDFHAEHQTRFNPHKVISALGATTASAYAGSGFFFGEPNNSLWSSASNITGAPDASAAMSNIFFGKTSRYLLAKDFDLDIPCNAVITDITFRVTRRNLASVDLVDAEVRLFNPVTLSIGTDNLASSATWSEGTWETVSYSDATWGETITADLLNDSRFGIVISAMNPENAGAAQAMIDAIEIVVCYESTTAVNGPIVVTSAKTDACFDDGSIELTATGGTGNYEYSIDGGGSWQASNLFQGLSQGDYMITVRNNDGTCQTANFFCTLSADTRIIQPGDAVVACATYPGNRATLAIEKVQAFNTFYSTGLIGNDISTYIPGHPIEWTVEDLCGEVFHAALDDDRNIYTATTSLYDILPTETANAVVSCISSMTGDVRKIATLPGDKGLSGVEYQEGCDQLFVANLEDGKIYRLDPVSGNTLSTFDPLAQDNGAAGYPVLGERIIGVTYNYAESRLYYSMWNSDYDKNGNKNTIRSVQIDAGSCDFVASSDKLEFELPWTNEYGSPNESDNFSMPVGDIEFSADDKTMLVAEVGFDSENQRWKAHHARVMQYNGSTGSWTLNTSVPASNADLQYEIGTVNAGLNSRGGVDFANAGMQDGCTVDSEEFIIATADALQGADCNSFGCIYGFQYFSTAGSDPDNSVLLNIGRSLGDQQKSIFGDVDIVKGCPFGDCEQYDLALDKTMTSSGPYSQGSSITYSIVVTNEGEMDASNVTVSDVPSAGLNYVSSDATSNANVTETSAGNFTIASLTVGASETINVTHQIANDFMGMTLTNTAQITSDDGNDRDSDPGSGIDSDDLGDGIPDDDEDVVIVMVGQIYDLAIDKSAISTGPYNLGSTVEFEIEVSNEGSLDANNIEVVDTPPDGLVYVGSDADGNANVTETSDGVFEITFIQSMTSEYIVLTYTIDETFSGTSLTNLVQITRDDGDDIDSNPDSHQEEDDLGDGIADDDEDDETIEIVTNEASLGDYIWEDSNGNGMQDGDEYGVEGVKVELFNSNGFLLETQFTESDGFYLFEELSSGSYYVQIEYPDGYSATISNYGGDDNQDSDLDESNGPGTGPTVNLTSNEEYLAMDFGILRCIPIGDLVWFDLNQNNIQDPFENGINGMEVELYRDEKGSWILYDQTYTEHHPTLRSNDGYFKFCVRPGTYYFRFVYPEMEIATVAPNFGINDEIDSDATGAFGAGTTDSFTVYSGDEKCDVDAGYYGMASIGDYVWLDRNTNGRRENGENGVSDVVVRAYDALGNQIAETTTDREGRYMIDRLNNNTIYLEFLIPEDMEMTLSNVGDDAEDSDVDHSNGPNTTQYYTVRSGEHMANVDAGVRRTTLGIDYQDFLGEYRQSHNYLYWMMKSDEALSHFAIERSFGDQENFEEIGKILSEEDNTNTNYEYRDYDVSKNGIYYYRIVQFGLDGSSDYSEVISITVDSQSGSHRINVYPNPVSNQATVEIYSPETVNLFELDIYDKLGRLVKDNVLASEDLSPGFNKFYLNTDVLDRGVYNLHIIVDNKIEVKKLIVIPE